MHPELTYAVHMLGRHRNLQAEAEHERRLAHLGPRPCAPSVLRPLLVVGLNRAESCGRGAHGQAVPVARVGIPGTEPLS